MRANTERISAKELRTLTGAKSLREAITLLYARLEKRTWKCRTAGELRTFNCSGIDWQENYLFLRTLWSTGDGAVGYRSARVPIPEAIDCLTGNFSPEFLLLN